MLKYASFVKTYRKNFILTATEKKKTLKVFQLKNDIYFKSLADISMYKKKFY